MSAWFYEYQGGRVGPVAEEEVKRLAASGKIGSDTLVWQEGFGPTWRRLGECDIVPAPPSLPPDLKRPAYRQSLFCGAIMLAAFFLFIPLLLLIPLIVWTGPVYAGTVRYTFSTAGRTIITVLMVSIVILAIIPRA